ncbi:MAG: hypothetical protein PHN90_10420 [Methanothrix sp.]|jgi:hypothetical protein|nr:hypothetical protein [Methanothrix sp.]OPX80415.1 MAG: hypothetical protein A4E50_01621 [Methanosaeta sp. PtaB.Bin087]OPY53505.1 MAG: hypothetical protein A4E51_01105 [Methanosaeta sp. PtaU1.Bin055]NLX40054.1 hypothetical protein [Methanothrix sp.]HNR58025.1 hypothetical protein [Methanothrix sp.]
MNKKTLEICASTGLVFLMIVLLILVQTEAPEPLRPAGFVLAVLAFMILMGLAGFGLMKVEA